MGVLITEKLDEDEKSKSGERALILMLTLQGTRGHKSQGRRAGDDKLKTQCNQCYPEEVRGEMWQNSVELICAERGSESWDSDQNIGTYLGE